MGIGLNEKIKLRKLIKTLKSIRGRHTELISVYLPPGSDLTKFIGTLQDEQGTATNIKDKNTSKAVITALERMIRTMRVIDKTPENGLAIFSGNISYSCECKKIPLSKDLLLSVLGVRKTLLSDVKRM